MHRGKIKKKYNQYFHMHSECMVKQKKYPCGKVYEKKILWLCLFIGFDLETLKEEDNQNQAMKASLYAKNSKTEVILSTTDQKCGETYKLFGMLNIVNSV